MSYFIGFRHSPSTLVHENRCDIAAVYALILLLGAVLLTPSSQAQTSPQMSPQTSAQMSAQMSSPAANPPTVAPTQRIRGVILALEDAWLSVQSRDGQRLRIRLDDKLVVSSVKAIRFANIRTGDFMGVTAMPRADGSLVALEVHTLPPSATAGFTPWDLQPGSTMTNATVVTANAQSAGSQTDGSGELLMDYKSGSHRISVPAGTPIVATQPGERAMLRPGETVFLVARLAADGSLSASRITVSRDGVRPPQ